MEDIADMQSALQAETDATINNDAYKWAQWVVKQWWWPDLGIKLNCRAYIVSQNDLYDKMKKGTDFLGTMNDKWKEIIGSNVKEVTTTSYISCYCWRKVAGGELIEEEFPVEHVSDCYMDGVGWKCLTSTETKTTVIFKNKPSDGVALNESSLQFPGVNWTEKMEKSNHMQMRNDENTKRVLLALYCGGLVPYFATNKRNP